MKTLDEVIKANECCDHCEPDSRCEDCPYNGIGACALERETDALHYLKAFRDAKNALDAERERTIEAYCQWEDAKEKLEAQTSQMMWVDKHFQFDISDNPALDWDELKSMKGKPVWVEYNLHISDRDARSRMWIIVQKIMPWRKDDELIYYSGFVFGKKEIGKTWQAYRKERNENAR